MTDSQLYLAVGVPALLFAANVIGVLWMFGRMKRRLELFETRLRSAS